MHGCLEDIKGKGVDRELDHIWVTFPITKLDNLHMEEILMIEGKVTKYIKKNGTYSFGIETARILCRDSEER